MEREYSPVVKSCQSQAFRNPYPHSAEGAPYLVVLQSDHFYAYRTVLVAPLTLAGAQDAPTELRPGFEIEGQAYLLNVLQMAPMPRSDIGAPITTLDRYRVLAAYDALISGSSV